MFRYNIDYLKSSSYALSIETWENCLVVETLIPPLNSGLSVIGTRSPAGFYPGLLIMDSHTFCAKRILTIFYNEESGLACGYDVLLYCDEKF